jgi:hypothetical protein
MAGEEAVNKPNMINKKKAEPYAKQARGKSNDAVKAPDLLSCGRERQHQAHGNQNHSHNCAQAEQQEVAQSPRGIVNRRQDQKRDCGRSCQTVNDSHDNGLAFAIGALAIGRLAIRRIVIDSAQLKDLKIEDLTVTHLRAAEVTITGSLETPATESERKTSL